MIHKYKLKNFNIVLDVHSGSIHVVDDIVYDLLDTFDGEKFTKELLNYNKENIETAKKEILNLKQQGKLYSIDDSKKFFNKKKEDNIVKALCLHIAHDCNLKCKYCFAEEGEYHGSRSFMSLEVGKKAIDFLLKNSGNRKNLEVDFFGGEPLMNFDVVKDIVTYAREAEKAYNKNIRFTITTNGVLLDDDKIKYINDNMYNVVLSIDGRKEVNDKMRKTLNDQSSYDIILPKFQKLVNERGDKSYYVRGTFTKENLDFSKDVVHLANQGFKQLSVEPVVAEKGLSYTIEEEDLEKIFEEYEILADELIKVKGTKDDYNFFHFMIDLTGGPCVTKRVVGCGAGSEYLAVTPDGDLFPCHQFVGEDEYKLGTVNEITNFTMREKFGKCNVFTKEECKKCWAKFYCSGGCMANAKANGGDILSHDNIGCSMMKKRIECAIMLKVKEALN